MFGKVTYHSFAEKRLLGGMSGKTCDMMGMDIWYGWHPRIHGELPSTINLEGNLAQ